MKGILVSDEILDIVTFEAVSDANILCPCDSRKVASADGQLLGRAKRHVTKLLLCE